MASCFNPWFSLSKIDWLLVPCSGSWCVQFSVLRLSKSQRLVIWICQLTYRYKYYTKTLCNFFVCLFFFLSFCTFGTRSWVVSFIVAIIYIIVASCWSILLRILSEFGILFLMMTWQRFLFCIQLQCSSVKQVELVTLTVNFTEGFGCVGPL